MTRTVRALALITVAIGSIGAAEQRQPTGRWVVNFDDAQCIASRNYGTDANPLFLALKAPPLGNIIQIGVVRSAKGGEPEQIDAQVIIDGRQPQRASMLAFTAKKQKQRAYWINLPRREFAPATSARVIAIRGKRELSESFAISAMQPLMKVLDDCVADLRRVWNVSEQGMEAQKLKEPVSGDLRGVFRAEDYPAVAIAGKHQGTVELALLIDETGKVAGCSLVETSGVASLDAQSCALVKERAKFRPAIGMDGKPAKGSFLQRITWRMAF